MKKICAVLVSMIMAVSFFSCKKEKKDSLSKILPFAFLSSSSSTSSSSSSGSGGGITIKGNFVGDQNAHLNWYDSIMSYILPSAYALDPNAVTKIVVFSGDFNNFYTSSVLNGSFSLSVDRDKPVGLVFAGATDNFLGYLSLSSGIQSIPLQQVDEEITTIDLETLTSNGLIVEPGNNPIGNEIILSDGELAALGQINMFFAAVVKNPDMDNDGKIDILTDRYYHMNLQYDVQGGVFGGNLTPRTVDLNIVMTHLAFSIYDPGANGIWPETITFTGPEGSGWSDTPNVYSSVNPLFFNNSTYALYSPPPGIIPPAGNYTVEYNSQTINFTLADQSNAKDNIVQIVPTVVLNTDNTIGKITWVFKIGSTTITEIPKSIIGTDYIGIQITGTGTQCNIDSAHGSNLLYIDKEFGDLPEHTLKCQNIYWSNVDQIAISYGDYFSNYYVLFFNK